MSELYVEKIMEEIREEIKAKGYTNDVLSFSDIIIEDTEIYGEKFDKIIFNEELAVINRIWNINPDREIQCKPGIKGRCVGFIKKVIRKCIRFYLSPIVREQDSFNATAVRLINMVNLYMEENTKLSGEVARLKNEQEELFKRVCRLDDNSCCKEE